MSPSSARLWRVTYKDTLMLNYIYISFVLIDGLIAGFKKEQLRVQIERYGRLRASGERPVDNKRWSRFRMVLTVPENCSVADVRAKFENEILYVQFRKLDVAEAPKPQPEVVQDANKTQQKSNGENSQPANAREDFAKGKEEKLQSKKEEAGKDKSSGNEKKMSPSMHTSSKHTTDDKPSDENKMTSSHASSEHTTDDKPSNRKKIVPPRASEADDKPSDEKEMATLPADGGREQTAAERMGGIATGLSQAKKTPLLNAAVASLVLVALAFYAKHNLLTTAETR
ncbi:hypothetical protein Cni_G00434 [Canna indica]|uniref:SHSP domain-containing protein n=1 Tax=Canna indica TaxID=4628 RepID=A0AAQ3JL35_9LILI|nr:hypothetical protein Cni_G00434 [Canna indica]